MCRHSWTCSYSTVCITSFTIRGLYSHYTQIVLSMEIMGEVFSLKSNHIDCINRLFTPFCIYTYNYKYIYARYSSGLIYTSAVYFFTFPFLLLLVCLTGSVGKSSIAAPPAATLDAAPDMCCWKC